MNPTFDQAERHHQIYIPYSGTPPIIGDQNGHKLDRQCFFKPMKRYHFDNGFPSRPKMIAYSPFLAIMLFNYSQRYERAVLFVQCAVRCKSGLFPVWRCRAILYDISLLRGKIERQRQMENGTGLYTHEQTTRSCIQQVAMQKSGKGTQRHEWNRHETTIMCAKSQPGHKKRSLNR